MIKHQFPKNFPESELLHSNTAERLGMDNTVDCEYVTINLLRVAELLQAIRNKLSKELGREVPIKVLSGYRSPKVNKAVGGSKTSAHMQGLAADIVVEGVENKFLANFIAQNFPIFDQIILEFDEWVHVGLAEGKPRGQLMTASKEGGKTIYRSGIL